MASNPPPDYLYQTVGFHFKVTFEKLPNGQEADIRFQSVTGLDVQLDTALPIRFPADPISPPASP
jgi:hypothetical protein